MVRNGWREAGSGTVKRENWMEGEKEARQFELFGWRDDSNTDEGWRRWRRR